MAMGFFWCWSLLKRSPKCQPQADALRLCCAAALRSPRQSPGDGVFGATSSEPSPMQQHLPGTSPSHSTHPPVPPPTWHIPTSAHGCATPRTVPRLCHSLARGQILARYPRDLASLRWGSLQPQPWGWEGGAGMGHSAGVWRHGAGHRAVTQLRPSPSSQTPSPRGGI